MIALLEARQCLRYHLMPKGVEHIPFYKEDIRVFSLHYHLMPEGVEHTWITGMSQRALVSALPPDAKRLLSTCGRCAAGRLR